MEEGKGGGRGREKGEEREVQEGERRKRRKGEEGKGGGRGGEVQEGERRREEGKGEGQEGEGGEEKEDEGEERRRRARGRRKRRSRAPRHPGALAVRCLSKSAETGTWSSQSHAAGMRMCQPEAITSLTKRHAARVPVAIWFSTWLRLLGNHTNHPGVGLRSVLAVVILMGH